jgi:hypothetical protein
MDVTRKHRTKSDFETVEACFFPMFLQRTGCVSSLLLFAHYWSCSVATITFVHFSSRVSDFLSWRQYIARKLFQINERGKYVDPAKLSSDIPADKTKLLEQEEELFQIARLINCGWFASGKGSDYLYLGNG